MIKVYLLIFVLIAFVSGSFCLAGPKKHKRSAPAVESTEGLVEHYLDTISDGQFAAMVPDQYIHSEFQLLNYIEHAPETFTVSPWIGSMVPSLIVRESFYRTEMESLFNRTQLPFLANDQALSLNGEEARRNFLRGRERGWRLLHPAAQLQTASSEDPIAHSRNQGLSKSKIVRFFACFRAAPLQYSNCLKVLEEVERLMSPVNFITAIPVIQEFLYNSAYADGISRAAVKLMDKVELVREGKNVTGDLFDDIYTSFRSAGIQSQSAEEMTWNALAVYSSRGPNMYRLYPYLPSIEAARSVLSLQTIAMAVSVLDAATYDSGHLYSLPKGIVFHAPYGKPYHFWMSAYLSRRMNQIFHNPEVVRKAIAMVEFAYQMFSDTKGREKLMELVATGGPYHPATQKVFIDVIIGYSGSAFGVLDGHPSDWILDLDEIMRMSIASASSVKPLRSTRFLRTPRMLLKFVQTIKPYTLMENVRFSFDCEGRYKGNHP